jgi:hypothetical protein
VLTEKLTVTQLVRKFSAFYGIRRFVTVFTRTRHQPEVLCNIKYSACLVQNSSLIIVKELKNIRIPVSARMLVHNL